MMLSKEIVNCGKRELMRYVSTIIYFSLVFRSFGPNFLNLFISEQGQKENLHPYIYHIDCSHSTRCYYLLCRKEVK